MAYLKDRGVESKSRYNKGGVSNPFYQSEAWKMIKRDVFLSQNRCKYCHQVLRAWKTLDHFRPLRFWPELALNKRNLFPSCRSCHSSKSAREAQARTPQDWERIVLPQYRQYDRMSFLNGKKGDKPP